MSRMSSQIPAPYRPTPTRPAGQNTPNLQPLSTDSVRFGQHGEKNATKTHQHSPTCCNEHSHACPTEPHEHNHDGEHAPQAKPKEPNWFSRFYTGLEEDVIKFYHWLKKLFSSQKG